ncbi:MAG: M48 family metallopeptidase [Opitutae bacterium]|nr:M48 family metallopeptidase [Opitutae bacterium]
MKSFLSAGALAAVLLGLTGCYTNPETGRQSVILISPAQESEMGAAAFAELRTKEKVSHDPEANARVQRVGARIAEAVGDQLPSAKWEFVVFDAPKTINAFALPGGKVGVYTGLLNLAKSDDELAIVMGHEIGHVTARHGAERMTEAMGIGLGAFVVDLATQNKTNNTRNAWLVGYGVLGLGGALKFSREHESEADHIGIRYAAKAGYNPMAAITFWQKMDKESKGGKLPEFLSTHPANDTRIEQLRAWMPEVLLLYEAAKRRDR